MDSVRRDRHNDEKYYGRVDYSAHKCSDAKQHQMFVLPFAEVVVPSPEIGVVYHEIGLTSLLMQVELLSQLLVVV